LTLLNDGGVIAQVGTKIAHAAAAKTSSVTKPLPEVATKTART
jgi:hypothetical protein